MSRTVFNCGPDENRFCYVPNVWWNFNSVNNDTVYLPNCAVSKRWWSFNEKPVDPVNNVDPENRVGSEENTVAVSYLKRMSNLEQFLFAIQPHVVARNLSERTMRGLMTMTVWVLEPQPYFFLNDVWQSFREWSAYGAGVPLVLNDNDGIVQYYTPFLSGIQIYCQRPKPSEKSRELGRDSDSDSDLMDSCSEESNDCRLERVAKYLMEQSNNPPMSDDIPHSMGRLSLQDHHISPQDSFSSDGGDSVNPQSYLLFEYLEQDPISMREPLFDKIMDLASSSPELLTLRSCDILPSSWISVAWHPIYRIPTGPELKDLDACFLTYHSLYKPVGDPESVQGSVARYPTERRVSGYKMCLPVFGLAANNIKGPMWTPKGGHEGQLASSLLQAAEQWLRLLNVNHPDFLFFSQG